MTVHGLCGVVRLCVCAGRIVNEARLRECVFRRGVAPSVRRTAWKFLLGVVSPEATEKQQKEDAVRMEQASVTDSSAV
jgi:hypothetical protein